MLIACKCLNLVANTNATTTATNVLNSLNELQQQQKQQRNDNSNIKNKIDYEKARDEMMTQLYGVNLDELEKLQKLNRIYGECLKFFRQSSGPLNGLQENIVQPDLICKVPINPWILYYCINCDTIAYAKQQKEQQNTSSSTTSSSSPSSSSVTTITYLINSTLLTNQEELNCLKKHDSFSDAFGILVMDRPLLSPINYLMKENIDISSQSIYNNSKSSQSSMNTLNLNKAKQIRYKSLTDILNKRLQKEIYETDARIRRYTEQQFALLKSFREKSEQEYQILVSLINQVPDEIRMIDAIDNNLITKISSSSSSATSTSSAIASTETTITSSSSSSTGIESVTTVSKDNINKTDEASSTIITTNDGKSSNSDNHTSTVSLFSIKQQQILNLDTPPATPDSTPMSVGNSPTFRQQTNIFASNNNNENDLNKTSNYNGGFGMMMMNDNAELIEITSNDTDCLFELEGMEVTTQNSSGMNTTAMSDVDETEDAEDALGELDPSAIQIPRNHYKKSHMMSIAKSLPISITNVPERRFFINELEDEIPEDTTIDIAASIKALAKSVNGDSIFGDLPRPRFSTQI